MLRSGKDFLLTLHLSKALQEPLTPLKGIGRGKERVTRPSVVTPQVIIVFNKLFLAQAVYQHTSTATHFLLEEESNSRY